MLNAIQMFPYKACGIYLLCGSSNPKYIGSKVHIDYNRIQLKVKERPQGFRITKNIYGSISVNEEDVKVIWVNSGSYELDLGILPLITFPCKNVGCRRMNLEYSMDDTANWITVTHNTDHYVLRRELLPVKEEDTTLFKMFITQLLLDLVIRHIG